MGPNAGMDFASFWINGNLGRQYIANMGQTNSHGQVSDKDGNVISEYIILNQWMLGSSWAGFQIYTQHPVILNSTVINRMFYDVKINTLTGKIDKKETPIKFFEKYSSIN